MFLSTVSKSFRACSVNDADYEKGVYEAPNGADDLHVTVVHRMTACSSVFGSRARVRLAIDLGFVLDPKSWWCQFNAGQCADIETLQGLHEQYQMPYTEVASRGAIRSGSVGKLQWLLDDQQCPQPDNLSCYAVHAPTLDLLKWLKQRGCVFTSDTCAAAVQSSPRAVSVLQNLHSEGVSFEASTMVAAINYDDLPLVQWLYEHGCPLSEQAALAAFDLQDLSVLKWVHSKGCPCDYAQLFSRALINGYIDVLQWARDNAVVNWSAELLTDYLKLSGAHGCLDTAQVR
jgi:hypothetical protein